MAKKAAKKATKKTAPKTAKKAPAGKAKKKAPAKKVEQIEIELGPNEAKALELVQTSDELCMDLEEAVTAAVSKVVREVYKKYKVTLTQAESVEVAAALFGD